MSEATKELVSRLAVEIHLKLTASSQSKHSQWLKDRLAAEFDARCLEEAKWWHPSCEWSWDVRLCKNCQRIAEIAAGVKWEPEKGVE